MTSRYTVICGCECYISSKSMHLYMLTWSNSCLKYLKDISHNAQNIRSGEISSRIFETYKNAVQPHGFHIYNTASCISMEKTCPCTSKHHGIPHWEFVLRCCDKCPSIVLPSQQTIKDITNTCKTIRFNVYRIFFMLYCAQTTSIPRTNNMFIVFHSANL